MGIKETKALASDSYPFSRVRVSRVAFRLYHDHLHRCRLDVFKNSLPLIIPLPQPNLRSKFRPLFLPRFPLRITHLYQLGPILPMLVFKILISSPPLLHHHTRCE